MAQLGACQLFFIPSPQVPHQALPEPDLRLEEPRPADQQVPQVHWSEVAGAEVKQVTRNIMKKI